MNIFAHRGYSGKYPENTMLAFEQAVASGSQGIEMDVHFSKDGKLVIIHDETLKRTTGKEGSVTDYLLQELVQINAGKTFSDTFGHTPIPSFDEYCSFIRDKDIISNVEIKTNLQYYAGIEEELARTIKRHGIGDKVLFSSFNWLSAVKIRALAPHIPCGLLFEDRSLRHIAYQAKGMGFAYIHPDRRLIDQEMVNECKALGVGLNVWTVNDRESLDRMARWEVDGVITNFPPTCLS
ncbi:MAG: glycerophosphodiester phosphodiesterase [Spirochaetia bacterium]|nr:glycerophosphodiester phosphodiesterase [Spirochaetia bacterium]